LGYGVSGVAPIGVVPQGFVAPGVSVGYW
jgi:hypothetical protein